MGVNELTVEYSEELSTNTWFIETESCMEFDKFSFKGDLWPLYVIKTKAFRYFSFHINFEPISENHLFALWDNLVEHSSLQAATIM